MEFEYVVPFLTLVIGWGLARIDFRNQTDETKQRALSRALAELLDTRAQIRGMRHLSNFLREIQAEHKLPAEFMDECMELMPTSLFWDDSRQARLDRALDDLSEFRPLAAHTLRAAGLLGSLNSYLKTDFTSPAEHTEKLSELVDSPTQELLDDVVVALAEAISKKEHKLLLELLEHETDASVAMNDAISSIKKLLRE